ncbi:hypothetical protein [Amycolatopsis thermophila]|uniref:Uncharacterized protein n=1 Tax=Amycolatopsis thermophila TaxID=206084 RepID=A0ABU0EMK0_9PSEU|nr:hypothetical protein [Amycolatopsis thermophila]MDQ0376496.1 hypothetical protein [Amycolatopsis thermophila]
MALTKRALAAPQPVGDPVAWPVAQRLLDCLCGILEDHRPVKCCCIFYGAEVPWDDCSADGGREGMAWVRITGVYPTDRFPAQAATATACGAQDGWVVTLELGAMRCAPALGPQGQLPGCDANTAAAEKAAQDAHAMRRALFCCDWLENSDQRFLVGPWTPASGGGCQGGVMTVTVHVNACVCNG